MYERDDLSPHDPLQNTVYIKSRMNWKETSMYKDALVSLRFSGSDAESSARIGAAEMAAMQINVLAWEGPGFTDERGRPIPCTPEMIEDMDPTEPFWQKVLGEINNRNRHQDPEVAAKKLPASTGVGGVHLTDEADVLASSTSRSSAQNGTAGFPKKVKDVTPRS